MTHFRRHGLKQLLAAGVAVVTLVSTSQFAHAQWIVFDPNNYVQNVLTAARALQEINNQLQSLNNEATMLSNDARNLTNLPYSGLAQFDQSIQATQQLLSQAQRIAYNV